MILRKGVVLGICLVTVTLLAIAMRVSVLHQVSDDMQYFLVPWYEHFMKYGLHGIATIESNYNVPYLYLLWFMSNFPLEPIIGVKLITIAFELLFCVLVYFIAREHYRKGSFVPLMLAIGALFVPTIFLQGALWGQCDIIYVTFLVASWWRLSKDKQWSAWALFGLALAFKLQAIFFLPYIVYMWFSRNHIQKPLLSSRNSSLLSPLASLGVVAALSIPALLAGRSFSSLIHVYLGQVSDPGNSVSFGSAVSVFQLLVNVQDKTVLYLSKPATLFAIALVVAILALYIVYVRRTRFKDLYVLPLLLLTMIPFFLPFMRNRYFFAAEIFALLFAALTRNKWFIIIAILLQVTVLPRYAFYLWHASLWPVQGLAVIQLSIIIALIYLLLVPDSQRIIPKKGSET